jgi:hypothetical protein
MRDRRRHVPWIVLALLGVTAIPHRADAQWRRDRDRDRDRDRYSYRHDEWAGRDLTFAVGALRSDDDDKNFPMAAVRVGWRLRSWLRSELGASYATGSRDRFAQNGTRLDDATLQLGTATLGLRAEAPLEYLRPYVGVSAGLFGQHVTDGPNYVRTTMDFPVGLRLLLSPRLALQAEGRFRFDQRKDGGQGVNVEQTGGIAVAF